MALPALLALEDCSSYEKTVEPFIGQLYELPDKLLQSVRGEQSLLELYTVTNPLVTGFAISIFLGAIFLVVSEVNKNYSQVDRMWSILPTFYIAHYDIWARLNGIPSQRLDAALFYSTIWSIRLTYNYNRRGGYNRGSEDYRWEIIKNAIPKWLFHIFNFTFISFVQSILLFFLAAPAYPLLLSIQFQKDLTAADVAYVSVELGLILSEWFSDQQQWDYHVAKGQYQKSAKVPQYYTQAEMDRGFCTSGLWAYSRHPNFAAEQTIWFLLYQWSCYATNVLYSWAALGPVCLLFLFQASTWLTELISAGKYPEYREYQRQVGMFVPMGLGYKTPAPRAPKVIRTSELAKRAQSQKQKQK